MAFTDPAQGGSYTHRVGTLCNIRVLHARMYWYAGGLYGSVIYEHCTAKKNYHKSEINEFLHLCIYLKLT